MNSPPEAKVKVSPKATHSSISLSSVPVCPEESSQEASLSTTTTTTTTSYQGATVTSSSHAVAVVAVVAPTLSTSNLLVSEQEDNDVAITATSRPIDEQEQAINGAIVEDEREQEHPIERSAAITSGTKANSAAASYADGQVEVSDGAEDADGSEDEEDDDDDESEYSYDYDDDDGHYSGFIVTQAPHDSIQNTSSSHVAAAVVPRDDIGDEGEKDEADEADKNGCNEGSTFRTVSRETGTSDTSNGSSSDRNNGIQFATIEQSKIATVSKSSWKEPSQEAVSMSLRAGKEKTGGRRRLASDLYKIMMNDTDEAGFSVESADEESMDKWMIRLFKFDEDSNLHKDMLILGIDHIELEMSFPDQYPFEPPFVRVTRPRFKKQTGFVMNGALCMELLTTDGWNPVNDIESVIVSIRSLLVVGDARLEAAANLTEEKRKKLLAAAMSGITDEEAAGLKKAGDEEDDHSDTKGRGNKRKRGDNFKNEEQTIEGYSTAEAKEAYTHLSSFHKKKGWSPWWNQKG